MATQDSVNKEDETPWYQNKWVIAGTTLVVGVGIGVTATKVFGNEVIEVIADTVVDGFSAVSDITGSALI